MARYKKIARIILLFSFIFIESEMREATQFSAILNQQVPLPIHAIKSTEQRGSIKPMSAPGDER